MTVTKEGKIDDHYIKNPKGATSWGYNWENIANNLKATGSALDFAPYTGDGSEASLKTYATKHGYRLGVQK